MTDQFVDANKMHPITPPPELYGQWYDESPDDDELGLVEHIATQAARWGADQELEACITWVAIESLEAAKELRAARRPKPPSLKKQALGALYAIATGADDTRELHQDIETIKTALEQLDD